MGEKLDRQVRYQLVAMIANGPAALNYYGRNPEFIRINKLN